MQTLRRDAALLALAASLVLQTVTFAYKFGRLTQTVENTTQAVTEVKADVKELQRQHRP